MRTLRAVAMILSVRYDFFFNHVRCGRLMARWKAENETSSMELSKRYGSRFSLQEVNADSKFQGGVSRF